MVLASLHPCILKSLFPILFEVFIFVFLFLFFPREPSFPGSILPPKQSVNGEMSLTTEQISQASDEAMSMYHMCSVPDIKHVVEPSVVIPMVALEKRRSILENTGRVGLVRKSARKSRKSIRLTDLDERQAEDNTISENESPLGGSSRHNGERIWIWYPIMMVRGCGILE